MKTRGVENFPNSPCHVTSLPFSSFNQKTIKKQWRERPADILEWFPRNCGTQNYLRSRRNLIIPERPWRIALSLVSTFDVISNSRRNVNCEGGNVNSILPAVSLRRDVVNFTARIKKLVKNRRSPLIILRVSRSNCDLKTGNSPKEACRSPCII